MVVVPVLLLLVLVLAVAMVVLAVGDQANPAPTGGSCP